MKILNKCKDYKILESKLDADTLNKIDKVLVHFEDYVDKNDDGNIDIIGKYCGIYGNGYLIDWYEGLMTTDEFLEEMKDYSIADVLSKEEIGKMFLEEQFDDVLDTLRKYDEITNEQYDYYANLYYNNKEYKEDFIKNILDR